jgi:hypothetical protein
VLAVEQVGVVGIAGVHATVMLKGLVGFEIGCSLGARGTNVVHATGVHVGRCNRLKDGVAADDAAAGCCS